MNIIRVLPPEIAERIAAGEVIERPSSVVKELVENSIDAGATEISVNLKSGGKDLIEIIDNGSGMTPKDLETSVQRHATSKLQSLDDLERILTLGFRGEALPSVAAVSELSILSRSKTEKQAFELKLGELPGTGEKTQPISFGHFLGSQNGTRIQARNLFSKIPARLKFLKSQGAEVSAVKEWLERLAISHPEIGFQLTSDDRVVLKLRPQSQPDRVRQILTDGEDLKIIERKSSEKFGSIELYWVQGFSSPQTRKIIQIVNGRAVRDRLLQQALLSPFRQHLLPGHFPAVVLKLNLDPILLDVNVHPTKTEIRFLNSREIFHTLEKVVESMILSMGAPVHVAPVSSETEFRSEKFYSENKTDSNSPFFSETTSRSAPYENLSLLEVRESSIPSLKAEHSLGRYVGILFSTYILFENGPEMILLDQHAADERVRYERLRKKIITEKSRPDPQQLLIPEVIKIDLATRPDLEERLPLLSQLGFDAELFGEDSVVFRTVPSDWGNRSLKIRLKNLIDQLAALESTPTLVDETLFEKLASEACHSAIRAGDRIEREEALVLVEKLFECENPWNCPHGRPTVVKIPEGKFEEWFKRRV